MPGFGDYVAQSTLDYLLQLQAPPVIPGVWVALFTVPPADDGTGGTEVTGGSYARVQVAGTLVTNGTTASGDATLHFASVPAWVVSGMTVLDRTTPSSIPTDTTIVGKTSSTVVLSQNVAGTGVGSGDTIAFSAWPAASPS